VSPLAPVFELQNRFLAFFLEIPLDLSLQFFGSQRQRQRCCLLLLLLLLLLLAAAAATCEICVCAIPAP